MTKQKAMTAVIAFNMELLSVEFRLDQDLVEELLLVCHRADAFIGL